MVHNRSYYGNNWVDASPSFCLRMEQTQFQTCFIVLNTIWWTNFTNLVIATIIFPVPLGVCILLGNKKLCHFDVLSFYWNLRINIFTGSYHLFMPLLCLYFLVNCIKMLWGNHVVSVYQPVWINLFHTSSKHKIDWAGLASTHSMLHNQQNFLNKDFCVKKKVKFSLEQAMKAQRGSRGIALLFL